MDNNATKKRKHISASAAMGSLKKPRTPGVKSSSAAPVEGETISTPGRKSQHSTKASKAIKAGRLSTDTGVGDRKNKLSSTLSAPTPRNGTKLSDPPTAQSDADDEQAEEEEEGHDDDDDELHGFSSGSDSSDDDVDDAPPIDVDKLPTIAKDDETVRRRLERAKKNKSDSRGVLFLGRIPHGFYEDQMRGYFSQFGTVTRLRMSRNKRTGASKHYAFIEFDSAAVAEIVADTMNNYLLHGHILQCRVVPPSEVHPELWVGANRKWRKVPSQRVNRMNHNKELSEEEKAFLNARLLQRQEEKKQKLLEVGINYDLDAGGFKHNQQIAEP